MAECHVMESGPMSKLRYFAAGSKSGRTRSAHVRYPIAKARGLCLYSTSTQTPEVLLLFHHTTHHGNRSSTGHSDKVPVLNQACRKRNAIDRPRPFYPRTAFLLGTRPFRWKRTWRRTVSLWRTRVPKPTRVYST